MIDITSLPKPNFVEPLSYETILGENKYRFLNEHCTAEERPSYEAIINIESEPIVKLLEESAYKEYLLRNRINEAALDTTLAYAKGNGLDVVAAGYDTYRFVIEEGDLEAVPPILPVLEDDESLRIRAQLADEELSTAGHKDGYRKKALDAHKMVRDVYVCSPSGACVDLYILSRAPDGVPTEEVLEAVRKACNPEETITISDRVTVKPAEVVPYSVAAEIFLYKKPESEPLLAAVQANAEKYKADNFKFGRSISRSSLYAITHLDGVKKVNLTTPAVDLILKPYQAPLCLDMAISIGAEDGEESGNG